MSKNNRLGNAKNPFQGPYKKVLCVCSAGLLRSPTMAYVLSQDPYNYNTRACGYDSGYALVPLDTALLFWADEIVVAEEYHEFVVHELLRQEGWTREVQCLKLPDRYEYRHPELVQLIKERYKPSVGEDIDQSV